MRSCSTNHWRTVFFLVGAGIARASGGGPGVEDDGGAAGGIEAGGHMLDPAPIGGRFPGETGPGERSGQVRHCRSRPPMYES